MDMRCQKAIDCSSDVLYWAKRKEKWTGNCTVVSLQSHSFK